MNEEQFREQLRKIYALFEGANTPGERSAAAAAIDRVEGRAGRVRQGRSAHRNTDHAPDRWQRRLFAALGRRYGLSPYRYQRQRYTTLMVRVPKSFMDQTLWRNTSNPATRWMAI
jgi:hypothetical protein